MAPTSRKSPGTRTSAGRVLGALVADPAEAHAAAEAGATFVVVTHLAAVGPHPERFLAGLLPVADANEATPGLAARWRREGPDLPWFAGVFAADPTRSLAEVLRALRDSGAGGIANYPSFRLHVDPAAGGIPETRIAPDAEAALLRAAGDLGLERLALAFSPTDATAFADLGCETVAAVVAPARPGPAAEADALAALADAFPAPRPGLRLLLASARPRPPERIAAWLDAIPAATGFLATTPFLPGHPHDAAALLHALRRPADRAV